MRKSLSPSERGFNPRDRQRLSRALTRTVEARLFRRIQAVLLVAEGRTLAEAVHITGLSLQSIYNLVHRYLQSHRVKSLHDLPHTGRPPATPELAAARIIRELQRSPLKLGYRTNLWTVEFLAQHLNQRYRCSTSPWTLRRRMKQMGLIGKRPRYFYSEEHPHRAQEKGPLFGN